LQLEALFCYNPFVLKINFEALGRYIGLKEEILTHSLHRRGCAESLKNDYVVILQGAADAFGKQKTLVRKKYPFLYGVIRFTFRTIGIAKLLRYITKRKQKETFKGSEVLYSKEDLLSYLDRLKKADTGKSVVVSGLIDEVFDCLEKIDLRPHTVQLSLGQFGKTDLLPNDQILELTTMCGHGMISAELAENQLQKIREGKLSHDKAIQTMSKLCTCNLFNNTRAREIIDSSSRGKTHENR
jgi:hypothetical protein